MKVPVEKPRKANFYVRDKDANNTILENAREEQRVLEREGKLHRVNILNGYVLTTKPERYEDIKISKKK